MNNESTFEQRLPKNGSPAHALLTLLTMGYCVEIIAAPYSSPKSFTNAIRELQAKKWGVTLVPLDQLDRKEQAAVYRLRDASAVDVADRDGRVPVISLYDVPGTIRGAKRRYS